MVTHLLHNYKQEVGRFSRYRPTGVIYEVLWDPSNPLYMEKNAKKHQMFKTDGRVKETFDDAETLRKKTFTEAKETK